MLIDWFTVAAQIVNFLILVWLLKRFLYARILNAIRTRESKIAARLAESETAQKAAQEQLACYQAKLMDFERRQESMLSQAAQSAEKERAEMIEKARENVQSLEMKWREDLQRERNAFLADLRRRVAEEVLTVARRAVEDLAGMDAQQCAVKVFLEKIRGLNGDAWNSLAGGELCVRVAFELPDTTRNEIQHVLEDRLHAPVHLKFERAPALGLGVELRGNGRRIGWSFENYFEEMKEDLVKALEQSSAGTGLARMR
jgi:F-type H+-transporting ATPase subunit b